MKKIIILALMLILTGCGSAPVKTSNKPQIYTSFYAIYDFVEKIGGDKVDVHNLVPSGTEPHDWEPSSILLMFFSTMVWVWKVGLTK